MKSCRRTRSYGWQPLTVCFTALHTAVARLTEAIQSAPVLLLDDLGAEYGKSQWTLQKVSSAIDHGYAHALQLPVVVTSNLLPQELVESGDLNVRRLADRLLDGQITQALHLTAPSFRKAAQFEPA